MIRAKNYEAVFKFVKVMPRKLVASFFLGHGVYLIYRNTFIQNHQHCFPAVHCAFLRASCV